MVPIFAAGSGSNSEVMDHVMDTPGGPQADPQLHSPFSFLVSLFVSLVLCDTHGRGWGRSRRLRRSWRDCTTSLFPCGLSPADSAPAPLISKILPSLLSSPLVALLSSVVVAAVVVVVAAAAPAGVLLVVAGAGSRHSKGSYCLGWPFGRHSAAAARSGELGASAAPLSSGLSRPWYRGPGCRTWRSTTPCPPRALASSRLYRPSVGRSRSRRKSVLQASIPLA
jgi:hypothetical protein